MSSSRPLKVEGIRQLRSALRKAGNDLQEFKSVNAEVAQYVGAVSANRAPRRTGMLAASWRPSGTKTQAAVKFGGVMVPYGNAVHWGTGPRPGERGPHNIRANRFAWDAAEETEPVWGPYYMAFIEKVMQRNGLE